jgi:hypothetical protein
MKNYVVVDRFQRLSLGQIDKLDEHFGRNQWSRFNVIQDEYNIKKSKDVITDLMLDDDNINVVFIPCDNIIEPQYMFMSLLNGSCVDWKIMIYEYESYILV